MREDEFEGRPELSKKRATVLLIEGFLGFVVIGLLITSNAILLIDAQVGQEARDQIVDCTTPEGECAQRNQKATGEILQKIYQDGIDRETITRSVIIAAVACAKDPKNVTYEQVEKCVKDLTNG